MRHSQFCVPLAAVIVLAGCTPGASGDLSVTGPGARTSFGGISGGSSPAVIVTAANLASAAPVDAAATTSAGVTSGASAVASPAPFATPIPLPFVDGARALGDRPDDSPDFQIHLLYALPADAADEALDTNGTIARSVTAANSWMAVETGGQKLRIDTYKGAPDVTFYRSPHTHAQLGSTNTERVTALKKELLNAGFLHPLKVYSVFYGGGVPEAKGTVELGLGGGGFANVFIKSCADCALATAADQPDTYEYTFLHETLHAMGFVPTCAPHVTADQHTTGEGTDLMAALSAPGRPKLDPGHNYFHSLVANCEDLAKSPYLDPRPTDIQAPEGRPLALDFGANAVRYAPTLSDANTPGVPSVEAQIFDALNALRQSLGKPALALEPTLVIAARRTPTTSDHSGWLATVGQVGFGGTAGWTGGFLPGGPASALAVLTASPEFKQVASSDTATAAGVGVIQQGAGGRVGLAYTDAHLQVEAASIGEGPLGTYTLAVQVRPRPGLKDLQGRVFLDGTAYKTPFVARASAPAVVFVSIARAGKHRVTLDVGQSDPNQYQTDQVIEVDGGAPAAQALTFN
jgi:hypothetical protein